MTFPVRIATLFSALASMAVGTAPLSSAQDTDWISQFGTVQLESGTQLAADGLGGVFAAANVGPQVFGTTNIILTSFDGLGQQGWSQTIGSAGRDEVWSAASASTGGFLVCGSTTGDLGAANAGSFDGWVGRFDAAGTQLWLVQVATASFDTCLSVATDGGGGAFVCGNTQGDLGGTQAVSSDAWFGHFDSNGAATWIRQLDSGASESATGIVPDGAGGVFVCGTSTGDLFDLSAGDADAWVARFDAAGNLIWGKQWGSSETESFVRISQDGANGVFAAGATAGELGTVNAGSGDVWITRLSDTGDQNWIEQFGTPENDLCTSIGSDLSGGLYLLGSTNGTLGASSEGGVDVWVARHNGVGERTWLRQFGTAGIDRPGGISVAQPGQLFLAGSTALELAGPIAGEEDAFVASFYSLISESYCSSPANSSGASASITASGSGAVALNSFALRCESLPILGFGYFLVSMDQGFIANPAGSQGNLCVSGTIGRFNRPGEVQNSGLNGVIELEVNPAALPLPLGPQAAQAGETWSFQMWFRDANPQATSNFSNGVAVTFN